MSGQIKDKFWNFISLAILMAFFIIIIYPFIWTILSSFKSTSEIFTNIWGLPEKWLFSNYVEAWKSGIAKYFLNSVFVTVGTVVLTLIASSLYAYSLVIFDFPFKKIFIGFAAVGMLFSPIISMIPLYQEVQAMGLFNTRLVLILIYTAYQIPMSFLLIHDYFLSIDHSYLDAARLDGCSDFWALPAIYVPMSRPILITCAVMSGFYAWNEFSFALILVKNDALRTIPVGLLFFQGEMHSEWAILLAGLIISAIPIVVFFIFVQKYFIAGLSGDGLKG